MINIINSDTVETSVNIDKCMMALKNSYDNWYQVKMNWNETAVDELWLTPNIYIKMDNNIHFYHVNGQFCWSDAYNYRAYEIIQTDTGILFNTQSLNNILVISETVNTNGDKSLGMVVKGNGTWYAFTDDMGLKREISAASNFIKDSTILTQLLPVCNPTGDEYFKDAFWTFIRKSNDQGKVILNNEYYYIHGDIAVRYTE